MDMETLSWTVLGWFAMSIVVSLAMGGFLREANATADESQLNQALSRRRILRSMRGPKPERKRTTRAGGKPAHATIHRMAH